MGGRLTCAAKEPFGARGCGFGYLPPTPVGRVSLGGGYSSGVEHCVVVAGVESSNLFTRPAKGGVDGLPVGLRSSGVERGAVNSQVVGSKPSEAAPEPPLSRPTARVAQLVE